MKAGYGDSKSKVAGGPSHLGLDQVLAQLQPCQMLCFFYHATYFKVKISDPDKKKSK